MLSSGNICHLTDPIILVSAKGHWPDLDDRLQGLNARPTTQSVAEGLNQFAQGVPTLLQAEDSGRYGVQQVLYFCTPQFIVRCVLKEDAYLLLGLRAVEFLYRQLPNWKAIRVQPPRWIVQTDGSQNNPRAWIVRD